MFLLRDGLLTLINNASFIALFRFWFSLPTILKIINDDTVTSGVIMVKYWRGCLLMFLEPLSKSHWGLSNVFLITIYPTAFLPIDDPTLLQDWILVFWGHQEVLDGIASFKNRLNVVGWIVMRNTLESPQGLLERGSRNIRRHPLQYLTILTPLVTVSSLMILV